MAFIYLQIAISQGTVRSYLEGSSVKTGGSPERIVQGKRNLEIAVTNFNFQLKNSAQPQNKLIA